MYTPYYVIWVTPLYLTSASPITPPLPSAVSLTSQLCKTQNEISPIIISNPVNVAEQRPQVIKKEQESIQYLTNQKSSPYKYAKKNVISFLTTKAKSQALLKKILDSQEKVQQAKNKDRKYTSRNTLQSLLEIEEDHPIFIVYNMLKGKAGLKLSEMRKALLKLTNYFLRNLIVPTLLTSSNLDKSTLPQHLKRARQIYSFVNTKPSL